MSLTKKEYMEAELTLKLMDWVPLWMVLVAAFLVDVYFIYAAIMSGWVGFGVIVLFHFVPCTLIFMNMAVKNKGEEAFIPLFIVWILSLGISACFIA